MNSQKAEEILEEEIEEIFEIEIDQDPGQDEIDQHKM